MYINKAWYVNINSVLYYVDVKIANWCDNNQRVNIIKYDFDETATIFTISVSRFNRFLLEQLGIDF